MYKFLSDTIPFSDFFKKMLTSYMDKHFTMLPGKITKYDNGRAEVLPTVPVLVKKQWLKLPKVTNVPVTRMGTSKANVHFPIDVNNEPVILIFSKASLDAWLIDNKENKIPVMNRNFHLNDAVALTGIFPFSFDTFTPENNTDVFFEFGDIKITMKEDGEFSITNGNGIAKCEPDGAWDFNNGKWRISGGS